MCADQRADGVRVASMEQLWEIMGPQLAQGGSVQLTVSGCSMYPMLRHREDTVNLRETTDLKQGDLILFRREDGSFVLHRIIRAEEDGWICCGDNQHVPEPVGRQQVLAKMTEFIRKGKAYSASHPGYKVYVAVWVWLFPVRRPLLAVRRFLGGLRRKLIRK